MAHGPIHNRLRQSVWSESRSKIAAMWLENFQQHLYEACLGQVSEIFDGDAPHSPRGCVAQAWSVAELLRAMVEDIKSHL